MIQLFIKNKQIRSFRVEDDKVYTTIEIDNLRITNPTLSQFKSLGWECYIEPEPEPYIPTKEELVEQKLRERYSINQEFEVLRKRYSEPDAFQTYYDYVEECITWANNLSYREE